MIRTILMAAAGLVLASSTAPAQRASIVRIDAAQKLLVVKLGEAEHKVDATKVTLLDRDGKVIALAAFAPKEIVMLTMAGQHITGIQKLREWLATQDPIDGKVVKVDAGAQSIVVRVPAGEHTGKAGNVRLLDRDGKPAKLSDFAAGDEVKVILSDDGVLTSIQLAPGS